ncbi:MAG: radical SAM family heme chaperone HemW [Ignavibacterium sp.]|nr:MAG: radical SAM family heme chaperone HemW [Ignavibacterium sp.]
MKETACYIHIPFCDHKCIYCDFYSIITSGNISPFLVSLKKEISYYAGQYSSDRILTSIYFGGGTPSLMEPEYLEEIITTVRTNFNVSDTAELTMETNPGTVNRKKLKKFKEADINRISIGIQSFHEDELSFLTRIHNSETAIDTVNKAADVGFDNISIDLIFNLPGQTKEKWIGNLELAIKLPIKHISAYSLILERGTILNKMVLDEKVILHDDDHDADLYETTVEYLTVNGFTQYEVSNFTKSGYECVHNNAYWRYGDYIGFGTSAHSFINDKRWWNYSSLRKYIYEIEKNDNAVANSEILSETEMHDEYVMLALRSAGLDLADYRKRFNDDWIVRNNYYFQKLKDEKLILIDKKSIRLTKNGYFVCDEILRNIL